MQDEIAQEPVEQVGVALAREHVVPQLEQFARVASEISQPLVSSRSQFAKLALHDAIAQEPVPQVAVAFAREHAVPHVLQLVRLSSETSQPFASIASQLP